jgi:hypothetical protein
MANGFEYPIEIRILVDLSRESHGDGDGQVDARTFIAGI